MSEWEKNFMLKVEQMRVAQRQFFKTRDPQWMKEAKRLEDEVDNLIAISNQRGNHIPADN